MTVDESSALTVVSGGNLTSEIVSGQNCMGNNKSRMLYREFNFYYPEGSTKHGHSWIYTHGARPIIDPKKLFGRDKELAVIEVLLRDKGALVLGGFHGIGKSTLASMFVNRMGERWKFAEIYWRKMDETTNISEVVESFLNDIGRPVKDIERYKITDQLKFLFQELSKAPYLLVFDNFEVLLDPQTNKPFESKIGFSELIEKANENCTKSKFIFISRNNFLSENGIRPFSFQVNGLDIEAGIKLLRREGLNKSEDDLKHVIKFSGGHPLALILLSQLTKYTKGTLTALLNDDSIWFGKERTGVESILEKVYNYRLSEDEKKVLQYLSIFRRPVPAEAIAVIANDPAWPDSRVEEIAWDLCLKSLLRKSGENYWEDTIIKKYAGAKFSEKTQYYKLACKYYLSLSLPAKLTKKENLQYLIEAHHYACIAKDFDQAINIISDYTLDGQLDQWGNYPVLVDLYSKMLPEEDYGNKDFLKNTEVHCLILGNLGIAYRMLGDLRKAVYFSELALNIIKNSKNKGIEGLLLGNLGLSYRKLGDLGRAVECSEQALEITKKAKNKSAKGILLGNLGLAYHELGEFKKAIEYYEQALKIVKKTQDRSMEGVLRGNLGLAYRKLGDFEKSIEYSEQAVKIAKETNNIFEEGIQLGNLGRAYHDPGEYETAIEHYGQALEIAKEVKNKSIEGVLLINMGLAHHDLGNFRDAVENYEKALDVAKETENRSGEGVLFGNMGRIYNDLGNPKKAVEYFQQALTIAKETENRIEEGVLFGNLGRTYHKLREPGKTIEHCEQALRIAKELENRNEEGVLLGNMGRAYNDLGYPKKAIEYYEQALLIAEEGKNRSIEGTLRGNLGLAYRKIGEFGKAIEYYEQALKIAKEGEDKYSQGVLLGNMGKVYHILGEHGKAIEYYEQSLSFGKEIQDQTIINFFKKNLEELKYSRKLILQTGSKQNKLGE
jgi:tetratricopeptide (TPR) repeat protein